MGIIYKYTSPSQKVYIGQTRNSLEERAGKDGSNYKGCKYFYSAIQKYGFENFKREILEECFDELLDEREKYWIQYYNSLAPNGYNLAHGGHKETTWSKIVYKFSLEGELIATYPSLTQAAKENNCNIGSISEVCSGRKNSLFGEIYSYNKEINVKPTTRHKKIYCFSEQGQLLQVFANSFEAAEKLNVGIHQIHQCAGKQKRKRINDKIITYENFIDWNYYTLKHQRGSTTIPNGSTSKQMEVLSPNTLGEDIVSTYEKS